MNRSLRILILGGTRYFGVRLVENLLYAGHEVTLLTRGIRRSPFGDNVAHRIADRGNESEFRQAVAGRSWDAVFDQSGYDPRYVDISSRVLKDHVGHYIYTSSQAVYFGSGLLREEDFEPLSWFDFSTENYANAKRRSESILLQSKGLPVTALRFPVVLGHGDYLNRLPFYILRSLNGDPVHTANPDFTFSLISSDEAAKALTRCAVLEPCGTVNVASYGAMTLAGICEEVASVTMRPLHLVPGMSLSPLERTTPQVLDTTKATRLGFSLYPIKQWLPSLIAEMRDQMKG